MTRVVPDSRICTSQLLLLLQPPSPLDFVERSAHTIASIFGPADFKADFCESLRSSDWTTSYAVVNLLLVHGPAVAADPVERHVVDLQKRLRHPVGHHMVTIVDMIRNVLAR